MIKAIIVDDEENIIEEIKDVIESLGDIKVVSWDTNPINAVETIKNIDVQIAFLDIDMPGMNGIKLAEKINSINPNIEIIFITAYNKYALEAFEVNAIDYILKPVRKERVEKSLKRIIKIIGENLSKDNMSKVKVRSFKKFEVLIGNDLVKWRILKDGELFAYLTENVNIPLHKEKIIQDLWEEIDLKNALIYLQSSIYRLRKLLSGCGFDNCISYANNCYTMKKVNIYCDIWKFREGLNEEYYINNSNISLYEDLANIYVGDYLEEDGYLWSINICENYRIKYLDLLENLADYFIEEDFNKAIKYLEMIIDMDPSYEYVIRKLFNLYNKKSDFYNLKKQFSKLNKLSEEKYGIRLSDNINEYYNSLIKALK